MDKYESFRVFLGVAEKLSFSRAAEALALPNATVTNVIQDLEASLGVRLLERTTRRVRLTPEGSQFMERARNLLHELEDTEAMFRRKPAELKGKVRVEMSVGVSELVLPLLPQFFERHPEVEIELSSRDYFVDLIREGIDCAIRSGGPAGTDLAQRPLGEITSINCASPAYLARFGRPRSLDDLRRHRLIDYTQSFAAKPAEFEYVEGGRERTLKMPSPLRVNNVFAYYRACLSGLGIAQLPLVRVRENLADGSLVEILPRLRATPYPMTLIYPEQRLGQRRVAVFMDWLEQALREQLRD